MLMGHAGAQHADTRLAYSYNIMLLLQVFFGFAIITSLVCLFLAYCGVLV